MRYTSILPTDSRGFSFLELTFALALVAFLGLAAAKYLPRHRRVAAVADASGTVSSIRLALLQAVTGPEAVKRLRDDARNASLRCLQSREGCPDKELPFSIVDERGRTLVDGRDPQAGFSWDGRVCDWFDPDREEPACALGLEARWRPRCPATCPACATPEVAVTVRFRLAPNTRQRAVLVRLDAFALDATIPGGAPPGRVGWPDCRVLQWGTAPSPADLGFPFRFLTAPAATLVSGPGPVQWLAIGR